MHSGVYGRVACERWSDNNKNTFTFLFICYADFQHDLPMIWILYTFQNDDKKFFGYPSLIFNFRIDI